MLAQYDELPVYKATYDLLLEMFRFTNDFSKEYKYTVGESLIKETIELITLIGQIAVLISVRYHKRPGDKLTLILQALLKATLANATPKHLKELAKRKVRAT